MNNTYRHHIHHKQWDTICYITIPNGAKCNLAFAQLCLDMKLFTLYDCD